MIRLTQVIVRSFNGNMEDAGYTHVMIAFPSIKPLIMQVNGKSQTTLWLDQNSQSVRIIDQTQLPHDFCVLELSELDDFCAAIRDMQVRGAPLIGVTAAYGLAIALREDPGSDNEQRASAALLATRPTAVNLRWAIERVRQAIAGLAPGDRANAAMLEAQRIREQDIANCQRIGEIGYKLLDTIYRQQKIPGQTLNILTHCNAGWLATVDWGTALAPIYKAQQAGLPIHVWVDETRPRNQGASLTAWELSQQGIPHTVIADNTGGHLMQQGLVDLCLVGSDRTTATGDVCNKIATYLKALAAMDNAIPFYVALPASTIDWTIDDGVKSIPIEQRNPSEVTHISGLNAQGDIVEVKLLGSHSAAANYAFDVTPARLVTGLVTEYGLFSADRQSLQGLQQQIQEQPLQEPGSKENSHA